MKSLYDFIVKPIGETYNNEINIDKKKLILNSKIESWKFVNRFAEVVEIPKAFKTPIKKVTRSLFIKMFLEHFMI
jgi:hypothetical protein